MNRCADRLRPWTLWLPVATALGLAASCGESDTVMLAVCKNESGTAMFEQRIAPLLRDDRPKTCNACHLSGIDMSVFVRSTPCETMACLQELGLVDLEAPEASQVLAWIDRAKPLSELIDGAVVQAEHDAFLEWIQHSARCGHIECQGVVCSAREHEPFCDVEPEPFTAAPQAPESFDCSDLALERLFRDTIYASRGRCFPCHFESEKDTVPEARHFIHQGGNCDESSLETMREVIAAGLVDTRDPLRSLLLLKPLAEGGGGVPHGGHEKFSPGGDPGYENFVYWLRRFAACHG